MTKRKTQTSGLSKHGFSTGDDDLDHELILAEIRRVATVLEEYQELDDVDREWLVDVLWRIGENREDPTDVFQVRGAPGKSRTVETAEKREQDREVVALVKAKVEAKVGSAKSGKAFNKALSEAFEEAAEYHGMDSEYVRTLWNKNPDYRKPGFAALTSAYRRKKRPFDPGPGEY